MPRFYFHVCNGDGFTEDEHGQVLRSVDDARAVAVEKARSIMSRELRSGEMDLSSFIEVEDEAHSLAFTLHFHEAVSMKNRHA